MYGSTTMEPSSSRQFSPTEFIILKESITNNIINIKKQYHKLVKLEKLIGGKNDTNELRTKIQNMKKQNNDVIKTTSSDIKKLSSIVKFSSSSDGSKSNRLMLEKLLDEFKGVTEKYLAAEKALDLKMRKTLLVDIGGVDESDDENPSVSLQQQKLMNAEIKYENKYLEDREEGMKKIETEVIDINKMMNEISTLIHDQSEVVETITDSVSNVATDIEGGVSELQKAENHQQKFRRKLLIILLIAIVVALIVCFSIYNSIK